MDRPPPNRYATRARFDSALAASDYYSQVRKDKEIGRLQGWAKREFWVMITYIYYSNAHKYHNFLLILFFMHASDMSP